MIKNETDLIKSTEKRILTVKAYNFIWKCIDISAKQKGLSRYHQEMKLFKISLQKIITSLIIDERKSIKEIVELIKSRHTNKINN